MTVNDIQYQINESDVIMIAEKSMVKIQYYIPGELDADNVLELSPATDESSGINVCKVG
jgi:hypothetical protein